MFNLTRKTDYALVALARLAQMEQGGGKGQRLSARQIAAELRLPVPALMGVLKDLHRAGLVRSTRGVRGGYRLAAEPASISVAAVVAAIEGRPSLTLCCDEDESEPCATCQTGRCPITHNVRRLNEQIHQLVASVTLADLLRTPDQSQPGRVSVLTIQDARRAGDAGREGAAAGGHAGSLEDAFARDVQ